MCDMTIDINKKYRTESGIPVTILKTDLRGQYQYPVLAVLHGECSDEVVRYSKGGKTAPSFGPGIELVEVSAYDHIPMDAPVIVWDDGKKEPRKVRQHFAGVSESGKPMTWQYGGTSWTYSSRFVWDHCELAGEK